MDGRYLTRFECVRYNITRTYHNFVSYAIHIFNNHKCYYTYRLFTNMAGEVVQCVLA